MRIMIATTLFLIGLAQVAIGQVVGKAGDILVANGYAQTVLLIDPQTGQQTAVLSGQDLPYGIATNHAGDVVFTDHGGGPSGYSYGRLTQLYGVNNWIDLVKPEYKAFGCFLEENGDVYYVRHEGFGLCHYSRSTGTATYGVSPNFGSARHVAKEPSGTYLVADQNSYLATPQGDGAIIRFSSGLTILGAVSHSGLLKDPTGIAVDPAGQIYVVDKKGAAPGEVIRIDPDDGSQQLISTGGSLVDPTAVAFGHDGALIVTDLGTGGAPRVVRIDPVTGAQSIVSSGGLLLDPQGVAVMRTETPVPALQSTWGRVKVGYR